MDYITCNTCQQKLSMYLFSNKARKLGLKGNLVQCKTCAEKESADLAKIREENKKKVGLMVEKTAEFNHIRPMSDRYGREIKLRHEVEVISGANTGVITLLDNIKDIDDYLAKLGTKLARPNKKNIMVLDLHNTLDLFLDNKEATKKLAEIKDNFGLVVVLSFVGKGDGTGSTRFQARKDIEHFMSMGVADFGMFVFQRGPAKGWACDTLGRVLDRGIYFSDDGDDHLESVRSTVPKERLLSVHKSIPHTPLGLYKWIFKFGENKDDMTEIKIVEK